VSTSNSGSHHTSVQQECLGREGALQDYSHPKGVKPSDWGELGTTCPLRQIHFTLPVNPHIPVTEQCTHSKIGQVRKQTSRIAVN